MLLTDFNYELPAELIAQQPLAERTQSKLLALDIKNNQLSHHQFSDLSDFLRPNDTLIFNDTKVIPARLFGTKSSGGKVEILLERILDYTQAKVMLRASKPPKEGSLLQINQQVCRVLGREGEFFMIKCLPPLANILALFEQYGHMPLPPYITRPDNADDAARYQTVYAKHVGAVAAPTAGLHFDQVLLEKLAQRNINFGYVTLHVGSGTFQPVRCINVDNHKMHAEYIEVDQSVCDLVNATKAKGGRVIAVGTTSVRSLESAASDGQLQPFSGDTRLFIKPGFEFQIVDAMITNFHLPKSSLLMLVSAFASREQILQAYATAIAERYRFFSYGDAMFLY